MAAEPFRSDETSGVGEGTQALIRTMRLGFFCLQGLMVVLTVAYLLSGQFIVGPDEQAFVLQFGAVAGQKGEQVVESGKWHWAWPKPVDRVVRVPVGQSRTITSTQFWYEEENTILAKSTQSTPPPDGPLRAGQDGYLLTGDSNICHSRWSLTYMISDPIAYYHRYAEPEEATRRALDNAVLKEVAGQSVDTVLYGRSEQLRIRVEERVKKLVDELDIGVEVRLVTYDRKIPPRATIAAFNQVIEAGMERSQKVSQARKERNEILQKARGEAASLRAEALSYKKRVVAAVEADAVYFGRILEQYRKAPSTMLLTLYTNTLRNVLGRSVNYINRVDPGDEVRVLIGERGPAAAAADEQ